MFDNRVHEVNLYNDYQNPLCAFMAVLVRNLSAIRAQKYPGENSID